MLATHNDITQNIPQRDPMVMVPDIKKGLPMPIGYIASVKDLQVLSLPSVSILFE